LESAAAAVSVRPALSEWEAAHASERVDPAHYLPDDDSYETDFDHHDQWCATSVAQSPQNIIRAATFYVPEVTPGALPPLPAKRDPALTGSCRLGGIWFQKPGDNVVADVVNDLAPAWGPSEKIAHVGVDVLISGAGLWKDVSRWRRGNVTVWLGWTNWDKGGGIGPQTGPRTVAWIVRDRAADIDPWSAYFDTTTAAAGVARLGSALTGPMTKGLAVDRKAGAENLERWIGASRSLPADRRVAALLVADSYVSGSSDVEPMQFEALGAKFGPSPPGEGLWVYTNNFQEQALSLGTTGPGGVLAVLANLSSRCLIKEQALSLGSSIVMLAPGEWKPRLAFYLARAHDVKLALSIPPGEADTGIIHALTPAEAERERGAAIAGFSEFVREESDNPIAVFAWQEAWRLLAGLPPRANSVFCSGE
jgi:hypothetical protein